MKLLKSIAPLLLSVLPGSAFQARSSTISTLCPCLYGKHQFNGGYDASELLSAKWNPREASEFVIWHGGDDWEAMGRQLTPLIQTWSGRELGEFLSRLYLGEIRGDCDFEIAFESRNVRTPQWRGLDTPEGLSALKGLLRTALPDPLLREPVEMAQIAQVFLWTERTWPALPGAPHPLERDSFANLGHTPAIVQLWMELREERGWERNFLYSAKDVMEMVPLHHRDRDWGLLPLRGMQEFFLHMGIRLAPSCKVELVQGLARTGWNPGKIAKLISSIPEIPEEEKQIRIQKDQEEPRVNPPKPVLYRIPRAPLERGHLDTIGANPQFSDAVDEDENTNHNENAMDLLATDIQKGAVDLLVDAPPPPKNNEVLEMVRKKIEASRKSATWQ